MVVMGGKEKEGVGWTGNVHLGVLLSSILMGVFLVRRVLFGWGIRLMREHNDGQFKLDRNWTCYTDRVEEHSQGPKGDSYAQSHARGGGGLILEW